MIRLPRATLQLTRYKRRNPTRGIGRLGNRLQGLIFINSLPAIRVQANSQQDQQHE